MNNPQIAAAFDTLADLLEFKGENPFRVRAYRTAARLIHDLSEPVTVILASPDRKLTDLAGSYPGELSSGRNGQRFGQ